jgi:hypothetical protein
MFVWVLAGGRIFVTSIVDSAIWSKDFLLQIIIQKFGFINYSKWRRKQDSINFNTPIGIVSYAACSRVRGFLGENLGPANRLRRRLQ